VKTHGLEDMPTVILESVGDNRDPSIVSATTSDGGRLLDLIDSASLGIELSCRNADCGACLIEVLEGEDGLFPAHAEEVLSLALLTARGATGPSASSRFRLACQAHIRPEASCLRLRGRDSADLARPADESPNDEEADH
jgi:ferredoxin